MNKLVRDMYKVYTENPRKGSELAEQLINIAIKKKDLEVELEARYILTSYLRDSGKFKEAIQNIHSIKELVEKIENKTLLIKFATLAGLCYMDMGDNDKAEKFYNDALNVAEKNNLYKSIANILANKSVVKIYRGERIDALKILMRALNISKENKLVKEELHLYSNLAALFFEIGFFEDSLKHFSKALKICESGNFLYPKAVALINMGEIYNQFKDYDVGIEYTLQGLDIMKSLKIPHGVCHALINLSKLYLSKEDYEKSLSFAIEAKSSAEKYETKLHLIFALLSLGDIYFKQKKIRLAKINFKHAALLSEEGGFITQLAESYYKLTLFPTNSEKRIAENISICKKAIEFMESSGYNKNLNSYYKKLSDMYESIGDLDNAFKVIRKNNDSLEKLFNEKLAERVATLKVLFDTESNRRQTELLKQKNNELNRINDEKNEFLGIVAHDLKNPISSIKMLSDLILMDINSLEKSDLHDMICDINAGSINMINLIENLLDVNKIENKELMLNYEDFDLNEVILTIVKFFDHQIKQKGLEIKINKPEKEIIINSDRHSTNQIFENIISNAVKYSPVGKNAVIKITVRKTGHKKFKASIKDQGEGMTASEVAQIFKKFPKISNKPTAGEHSTGLGLSIVKKLAGILKFNLQCKSRKAHGTEFIITNN